VRPAIFLLAAALAAQTPDPRPGRRHSTPDRMTLPRLAAATADVARLAAERKPAPGLAGLTDYKGIFHAHASDSAHTGGTLEEMLADAQRAGVSFIFLGSHYRPPRDFIRESWRGLRGGVLFVAGAEMHGFLLHPVASVMDRMEGPRAELIRAAGADGGLLFLSHVEERVDHPMDGLTGMEIYNRHADALDDSVALRWLAAQITRPDSLAAVQAALRLYPDAMLAAQLDYPELYLKKWDRETRTRRVVGVAANDCHHNQEFVLKAAPAGAGALLGTIVDRDADFRKVDAAAALLAGVAPGAVIARLDFDPYFRSFFNVSTHAFAPELNESAIRAAVGAGHVYVAHDWMGDPRGFLFAAFAGGERAGILGDELPFRAGLRLRAAVPLAARLRILKDGAEWKSATGRAIEAQAETPGVYRLEAWLEIDGEQRPWIYANPIYLR
jgi:hypothetical protein